MDRDSAMMLSVELDCITIALREVAAAVDAHRYDQRDERIVQLCPLSGGSLAALTSRGRVFTLGFRDPIAAQRGGDETLTWEEVPQPQLS